MSLSAIMLSVDNTCEPGTALSFEQTVPRRLVHKHSLENVLLTGLQSAGDGRFFCGAHMPKVHRFFNETARPPHVDIMFYSEVGRQACIAISHTFFGASRDSAFIFEHCVAHIPQTFWRTVRELTTEQIVIEVQIKEKETRKNGDVSRIVAEHRIFNEREQVFHSLYAWNIQPAALFERFRRRSTRNPEVPAVRPREAPMSPAWLGRELAENVVISTPDLVDSGNFAASLIVDPKHPFFFDHPCDHVPGILLMEGCAQMATTAASLAGARRPIEALVSGYEIEFAHFVECHLPVTLEAHVAPMARDPHGVLRGTVEIRISQQEILSGTAVISVAFPNCGKQ